MEMALSPKIIATSAHPQNRGACDWGWPGLLAYGSHQYVVVADPSSSKVTQVLGVHKGLVTCVKWKPDDIHHDVVVNPYTLTLAAGDTNGDVILWNVTKGEPKSTFVGKGRVVRDITWITNQETSEATILVLYNKGFVIMWDFLTSSQLWQTSFTEPISNICIDPFNKCNAVFLCEDSNILLIEDLHPKAAPSQKYRRISFYGTAGPGQEVSQPGDESTAMRRNPSSLNKFINMTTSLITGTGDSRSSSRKSISEDDRSFLQQCLQVVHHPGIRHVIFMVYPSQVDIIDTEVCIVMATIRLDSKSSYFVRVLPCKQKDALYCLHENACITIRVRRQDKSHCAFNESQVSTPSTPASPGCNESGADKSDITYDLIWQSDAVRLTNQSTVYGFGLHPGTEAGAALIFSDGKIILWELVNTRSFGLVLKDMFPGLSVKGQKDTLTKKNRFLLTGMVKGFPSHICTIKSNLLEQVTTANNQSFKPKDSLLALGMENGEISLLNIQTGQIEREISVHSDTVKGIEWINQNILLSWTCSKSGNSPTTGRNEVFVTWIRSGLVEIFRYRQKLESLITNVKVSPLRQYVAIAFKTQPLEVWCIQTKSLLREMPAASFPQPRALTWAPLCSWKTVVRQLSQSVMNKDITDMTEADITNLLHDKEYKKIAREQCVLADKDGAICRITLEERAVWDVTIYPPEVNGMSSVTHIAMKDDMLILGDATGMLCLWNLTERKLKSVPRSGDKPYSGLKTILFNPSTRDHFFAVLYDLGVDIWLFSQHQDKLKLLGSVKHSKNMPKVKLLEWADFNHVSMVMDDGSIHVVEYTSSKVTSSWNQRNSIDTVFCPHTLPVQGSLVLKHLLQNVTSPSVEYCLSADKVYLQKYIDTQLELIDKETINALTNEKYGTAQRCLTTARLFGDEFDVNFWTTALYFLHHAKDERSNIEKLERLAEVYVRVTNDNSAQDIEWLLHFLPCVDDLNLWRKYRQLLLIGDEAIADNGSACYTDHNCSDAFMDCLRPQSCYTRQQYHRVEQHNKKRKSQANRHRCIQKFTMMGRLEDATKILLETDFQSGSYREDYLQACLLSSDRTNSTAQSTLKLVATHLIISGKLEEGVVILCLLDKVLDACRYLQTYDQWEQAAWLAKLMLNEKDCEEVFLKWIEHLTSTKQLLHAVYIMMSRRKFDDVLKTLHYIGYIETAACFLKASQELGFQLSKDEAEAVMEKYHSHIERLGLAVVD